MKALVVEGLGQIPKYIDFSDPKPLDDEVLIEVTASALSRLTRSQASGEHYSSNNNYPFIPGSDGVGKLTNGQRVYFAFPKAPYGAMAELTTVNQNFLFNLPDTIDDITAAALANPGMSSWAALTNRAKFIKGETVLINGATGVSGRLAIEISKHLGAKKIIATGRNKNTFQSLYDLGADMVISSELPKEEFSSLIKDEMINGGIDVVLDYLWGESAEKIISAIVGKGKISGEPRVRFVNIGSLGGPDINLPASVLRSSGIEIMGSGIGSNSVAELLFSIKSLMEAYKPDKFKIEVESTQFSDVENQWNKNTGDRRLVFTR